MSNVSTWSNVLNKPAAGANANSNHVGIGHCDGSNHVGVGANNGGKKTDKQPLLDHIENTQVLSRLARMVISLSESIKDMGESVDRTVYSLKIVDQCAGLGICAVNPEALKIVADHIPLLENMSRRFGKLHIDISELGLRVFGRVAEFGDKIGAEAVADQGIASESTARMTEMVVDEGRGSVDDTDSGVSESSEL